jgi:phosphoglucomutase
MGGAGVHYWARIAERYELDLTVVSEVDPTFRFMSGLGRHSNGSVVRLRDAASRAQRQLRYRLRCDTDHDRHGIVTASEGSMPSNHYLAAAVATC